MDNGDLFLPDDKYFIGKKRITGIYQTGRRRYIRENTEKGDELTLKREYDNRYDLFAVAVYNIYGEKIGYIEKRANEDVAFFMDNGYICTAVVTEIDKKSATVGIVTDVFCLADDVSMSRLNALFEEYLRSQIDI